MSLSCIHAKGTLQALRLLFGFSSYCTCYLTVHERKDVSHSNTTAKKKNPLGIGYFLYYDKAVGKDKRTEK